MNAEENSKDNQLIYLDSQGEFIYNEEFENLSKESIIKNIYVINREDMKTSIEKYIQEHHNKASYYITGPKSFVKSTAELLIKNEINKKNIKRDTFIGY